MEVKSQEQKTFTYTLSINSGELDALLEEYSVTDQAYGKYYNKIPSLFSKLKSARDNDLLK